MNENYDVLFEDTPHQQEFDKEAWAEQKKAERSQLFDTIETMVEKTLSDPAALESYLTMQANLGKTSLANTLLVTAQNPNATYIASYDSWAEKGRNLRKGEGKKPIKLLQADKEYTRDDGSKAMGYKVDRAYDIKQTYGKPISPRATIQMPIKSKLRALTTDTTVRIALSDSVPKGIGAEYQVDEKTIQVARGIDGNELFFSLTRELARSDGLGSTFQCDCAANIACLRYGIPAKLCDRIPDDIAKLDATEKRELLSCIRDAAVDIVERVDRNLYQERQQNKSQPER